MTTIPTHSGAFIVSSGRCGSTLMSNLVKHHPDILSLSEVFASMMPRAFTHGRLSGKRFWKLLNHNGVGIRKALNDKYCPDELLYEFGPDAAYTNDTLPPLLRVTLPVISDEPEQLLQRLKPVIEAQPCRSLQGQYYFLFAWLTEDSGKKMWVERSGVSLTWMRALRLRFPKAKYVHVYRDGRDVALSINNHAGVRTFAHNWVRFRKVGIDLMRPPFGLGSSKLFDVFEGTAAVVMNVDKQLETPLSLHDIGTFWSEMVKVGMEQLDQLPADQRFDICYEDLLAEPEPILRDFINFLDPALAHDDWLRRVAQIPSAGRSNWKSLSKADRDELEAACAQGLERLGYAI